MKNDFKKHFIINRIKGLVNYRCRCTGKIIVFFKFLFKNTTNKFDIGFKREIRM